MEYFKEWLIDKWYEIEDIFIGLHDKIEDLIDWIEEKIKK
tara:strand:+ start:101628 stop:101747 length:120 start_codon:yes stop_codon:yes gene_type:complete